ncbi:MAG: hypothetical protein KDD82_29035, partial [Planctomycetes bacterium]|nr:hypothetical protein [Planctomycetota bacterium]
MQARTPAPSHRPWAWLLALALAAASVSSAQDYLDFDPQRRVYFGDGVQLPEVTRLETRLKDHTSYWRYYAVLVNGAGQTLYGLGLDVQRAWEASPDFPARRAVIVVCDLEGGTAAVVPPASTRDRLGLTLKQLAAEFVEPYYRAGSGAGEFAFHLELFVNKVDEKLNDLDEERQAIATRRLGELQDRREALTLRRTSVSQRLTDIDLRCRELTEHRRLDLRSEQSALRELRRRFADALEIMGVIPQQALSAFNGIERDLDQIASRLERLDQDGYSVPVVLEEVKQRIEELRRAQRPDVTDARLEGTIDAGEAAVAVAEGEWDGGRPDQALATLQAAKDRLLAYTPQPTVEPSRLDRRLIWAGIALLGLILFVLGVRGVRRSMRLREQAALYADLRDGTVRHANALEEELRALTRLYTRANRPQALEVPASLDFPPGPPPAREFGGETAQHLRRLVGRLESLHAQWRALRARLTHARALRVGASANPAALETAVQLLERGEGIPVTEIREAARELERIEGFSTGAERMLQEAADNLRQGELLLEDVLRAGQSTLPFEDDFMNLMRVAHRVAFRARRDPVSCAQLLAELVNQRIVLEERVRRTEAIATTLRELDERIGKFAGPRQSLGPETAGHLAAWLNFRRDEVWRALEDGARHEARLAAERLQEHVRDVELLEQGPVADAQAELQLLREEVHVAKRDLDALGEEFAPRSWADAESALLKAAARVELLAEELAREVPPERLPARLAEIRNACLLTRSRLESLREERNGAKELIKELAKRLEAQESFVKREFGDAPPPATARMAQEARGGLEKLKRAANAERPDWGSLLSSARGLLEALDVVRICAGEEALQARRSQELGSVFGKWHRQLKDQLKAIGAVPAATESRIKAADEVKLEVDKLTLVTPHGQRLAYLQAGIETLRHAREVYSRATRLTYLLGSGWGGVAEVVLLARQAWTRVHWLELLGLCEGTEQVGELVDRAEELLEHQPTDALRWAEEALAKALELTAEARGKESGVRTYRWAVEFEELRRGRASALTRNRKIRRQAQHRRTRFEILVLGEDAPDDVDLDAQDDSSEADELEALEEYTSSRDEDEEEAEDEDEDEEEAEDEAEEEAETEAEAVTEAETETETEADAVTETETEAESGTETEADAETETEADAETETEADAETETEADAETETEDET